MLKRLLLPVILLPFFALQSLASELALKEPIWEPSVSFLLYLQKNSLPLSLFHQLDASEQELAAEIHEGVHFYELRDETGRLAQALIPISEELQLHIFTNAAGEYELRLSPTIVQQMRTALVIEIHRSMHQDVSAAASARLANEVQKAFPAINYKNIRAGDRVAVSYSQKVRAGRPYGQPVVHSAMVQVNNEPNYVFNFQNDFYNEAGKQIRNYAFILPVGPARISSPFNPGRFHPILKKYRAHLGIDYAVPTGTPIRAAGSGKVIFRGRKGGYGNVLQIDHGNGYMTLYAHQSRFGKYGVGSWVRQGAVIGYVGTTGLSTGPHLHFGMYLNRRAINPAGVVKVVKNIKNASAKKEFQNIVAKEKKRLDALAAGPLQGQMNYLKEQVIELK